MEDYFIVFSTERAVARFQVMELLLTAHQESVGPPSTALRGCSGYRSSSDLSSPTPQLCEPRHGLHSSKPQFSPSGKGDRALPHGLLEKSRLSLV